MGEVIGAKAKLERVDEHIHTSFKKATTPARAGSDVAKAAEVPPPAKKGRCGGGERAQFVVAWKGGEVGPGSLSA